MDDFTQKLVDARKSLRRYAIHLCRDVNYADDLVHDTIVKAIEMRGSFEEGSNLTAWACRIQRNLFYDQLRRWKRRSDGSMDDPFFAASVIAIRPADQESKITAKEMARALLALTLPGKSALLLKYIEGMDHQQIATLQGVRVGTIKSRIFRAREKLLSDLHIHHGNQESPT